jgi:O-antigen/teichoic acid export membrane protein
LPGAEMEHKDHLIKDSMILFVASTVVNLANFIFHSYASRLLGPEQYGVLVPLLALIIIVGMPAMALQMTIVKKTSIFKAHNQYGNVESLLKKTIIWFSILGAVYFAVFAAAGAGLGGVKEFFHIDDGILYYILGGIAFVALMVTVVRGILQGLQNFIGLGATMIIDAFARLAFLYVFVNVLSWGARGALATTFTGTATAFILGMFLLSYIFKYKDTKADKIKKRDIFSYALPVFFSMLGFALLSYMDVFMVKHFFSSYDAGLYSATSMIGKAFLYFPSAIVVTLFPKVSESHELNKNTISLLGKSLALTLLISLCGIIFCFFFPKVIIGIMFGEKFFAIEGVVRFFGAAILPLVLFNVLLNYSLAVHKYGFIYIMYFGIVLYAAALWFFHGTFYQVVGVLFSVNMTILILSCISLYFEKKVKKIEV